MIPLSPALLHHAMAGLPESPRRSPFHMRSACGKPPVKLREADEAADIGRARTGDAEFVQARGRGRLRELFSGAIEDEAANPAGRRRGNPPGVAAPVVGVRRGPMLS